MLRNTHCFVAILVGVILATPAVPALAADLDLLLVGVRDSNDPKILAFKLDGTALGKWNNDTMGGSAVSYIDWDGEFVYVTTGNSGNIRRYTEAGEFVDTCCGGNFYPSVFVDDQHIYASQQDPVRAVRRYVKTSPYANAPGSEAIGADFTHAGEGPNNSRSMSFNAAGNLIAVSLTANGGTPAGLFEWDSTGDLLGNFTTPNGGGNIAFHHVKNVNAGGKRIYGLDTQQQELEIYNWGSGNWLSDYATGLGNLGNVTQFDIATNGTVYFTVGGSGLVATTTGGSGVSIFANGVGELPSAIKLIPEPATSALMMMGGAMLLARRRRA
jgi:hypothetical protein